MTCKIRFWYSLLLIMAAIVGCSPSRPTVVPATLPTVQQQSTATITSTTPRPTGIGSQQAGATASQNTISTSAATLPASETAVPATKPNSLYEFGCAGNVCHYMDLAEDLGGAYATRFDFSSEDHDRPSSPAHALVLAFSYFSNRLAYWTQTSPGQLWVSDLDYQNPELVFTDSSNQYPANHPTSSYA